jgi:nucleoside-diphosphate-sugar epimerase
MTLEGSTVAVTGAGGFIGRAVCERLAAAGALVRGLDLDASSAERVGDAGATFAPCDVTDAASVDRGLEGCELVVHAAARVSDWGPMSDFVRVNVGGTKNVLDAAARAGCTQLVHVSSVAIWGYEHREALDEDAEPRPCGIPYIDTKGASDSLARDRGRRGEPVAVVGAGGG